MYSFIHALYPVHFGFVLLNEGASDEAGLGGISHAQIPILALVMQELEARW